MDEQLATLERRVAELEKEVSALKANRGPKSNGTVSLAVPATPDLNAMLKSMGIEDCEPIGAEQLQQRLLAEGIRPEENVFSRGIIDMREE